MACVTIGAAIGSAVIGSIMNNAMAPKAAKSDSGSSHSSPAPYSGTPTQAQMYGNTPTDQIPAGASASQMPTNPLLASSQQSSGTPSANPLLASNQQNQAKPGQQMINQLNQPQGMLPMPLTSMMSGQQGMSGQQAMPSMAGSNQPDPQTMQLLMQNPQLLQQLRMGQGGGISSLNGMGQ